MYLTGTYKMSMDAKARLTLPAAHRKELGKTVCLAPIDGRVCGFTPQGYEEYVNGLFGDVTVVGSGDHFEIWNSEKWAAEQKADRRADLASTDLCSTTSQEGGGRLDRRISARTRDARGGPRPPWTPSLARSSATARSAGPDTRSSWPAGSPGRPLLGIDQDDAWPCRCKRALRARGPRRGAIASSRATSATSTTCSSRPRSPGGLLPLRPRGLQPPARHPREGVLVPRGRPVGHAHGSG
jgi:DNA-binding transcriptional regulator/RsmH inhibitor MraZ